LHLSEIHKEQLEQEIMCINKEKAEILEQLQHVSRQKNALAEDLLLAKKDIERLSDNNMRLTKEKEELNKERNNLVVDITASERENRKHAEVSVIFSVLGIKQLEDEIDEFLII
jgi:hypothetical protein